MTVAVAISMAVIAGLILLVVVMSIAQRNERINRPRPAGNESRQPKLKPPRSPQQIFVLGQRMFIGDDEEGGYFEDWWRGAPREPGSTGLYVVDSFKALIEETEIYKTIDPQTGEDLDRDDPYGPYLRGKVNYQGQRHWVYTENHLNNRWGLLGPVQSSKEHSTVNEAGSIGRWYSVLSDTGPSQEGRYPEDWDHIRREIYRRDQYTCGNCQRKGGPRGSLELHVHHIVPLSRGGTNDAGNLVTLCEECHRRVHPHMAQ